MLARVDGFLRDEGIGFFEELAAELAFVVTHGVHEHALAVRERKREGVEHGGADDVAAEPGGGFGQGLHEAYVARGDGNRFMRGLRHGCSGDMAHGGRPSMWSDL